MLPTVADRDMQIDYFDNMIEQLDELRKIPFFGEVIEPWITKVHNTLEQSNRITDRSLANVFNSLMPCNFGDKLMLTCQGTLDVDSAKLLIKKVLSYLAPSVVPEKYTPMIQFAAKMI